MGLGNMGGCIKEQKQNAKGGPIIGRGEGVEKIGMEKASDKKAGKAWYSTRLQRVYYSL